MSFIFDTGYLFGVAPGSNQTPVRFGSLQGIDVNLSAELVKPGRNMQFAPVQTIRGMNLELTAKVANFNGLMMTQLFFGQTPSAGSQAMVRDLIVTVPAGRPWQITPTVPNSGTWVQDLGLQYTASGVVLTPVASGPAQGQYSVSAGVYTFAAADAGAQITVNYLYSQAKGVSLALTNPWQGLAPTWQAILNWQYNSEQITWNLARCSSSNLKMLAPLEKIVIPEFKFQAYGDASSVQGSLGTFSYGG